MSGNYGGKVNNSSAYVRGFIPSIPTILWKPSTYSNINVLTTNSPNYENVYIPGNLYVDGSIINPSDINLKDNIEVLNPLLTNKLEDLRPVSYTLKSDKMQQIHYGFIAQELEEVLPELVEIYPQKIKDTNNYEYIKSINYLGLIPLLVHKIQILEKKIKNIEENK